MVDRRQIMRYRARAQQIYRDRGTIADTAILDFGAQDTGPDGGAWALALRGADTTGAGRDLVLLWTIRGAPHLYRRSEAGQVAAAVAPWSDADAAKRIFDASKPLRAAGIGSLAALDAVAERMRDLVTEPTPKGEVSGRLAEAMPEPYLRYCRVCEATHLYEQPFRLSAVRAGIELEPGTSPPVMRRIPGFEAADAVEPRFDLVRDYLRFLGPATPKQAAEFIDSPVKEVKAHWPEDAVEVEADGERRWILAGDLDALEGAEATGTRLVGPYDLFIQGRDRATILPDASRRKALWPVLGRPGAVVVDGEVAGVWRPRKSGKRFKVAVEPWRELSAPERGAVEDQAERLASHRGAELTGVDFA
ncbi:winged helix DNA-binding domain-containing protein [Glycomyces salinus]|uniref:winged helix DNA-binding domain-containing protein n=1 Tax=Glycomyces salinus TaxID=980294 RepID=UPI0018ED3CA6|nr:winged helix DNA-binding domain-containing protein [Glycomyces salinus]